MLKEFSQGLSHLFFPNLCQGCKKPLMREEQVICIGCYCHLAETNYHHIKDNETAMRLFARVSFQHATSFSYFTEEGLLQHLIHGLKYKGQKQNGIFLGKELGKVIRDQSWDIDAIIPVPLHPRKEAKRGYNQSECIAEGISEILKVPILSKALVRSRFTESQTDKTREQRIQNVSNAFKVKHPELIKGRHLLLIDDVVTTGATLEACAASLLEVPDVMVSIATVGIAH